MAMHVMQVNITELQMNICMKCNYANEYDANEYVGNANYYTYEMQTNT